MNNNMIIDFYKGNIDAETINSIPKNRLVLYSKKYPECCRILLNYELEFNEKHKDELFMYDLNNNIPKIIGIFAHQIEEILYGKQIPPGGKTIQYKSTHIIKSWKV